MTRDELIEAIRRLGADVGPSDPQDVTGQHMAYWEAIDAVLKLAEQLDSPPAMTWHKSPIHGQWHWVERVSGPRVLWLCRGEWMMGGKKCGVLTSLNGRRVCPIPAPPELPKRGDA